VLTMNRWFVISAAERDLGFRVSARARARARARACWRARTHVRARTGERV